MDVQRYTTKPLERNVFVMSILPKNGSDDSAASPLIHYFFRKLDILKLLQKCNFNKEKGVPIRDVFLALLQLAFTGMNLYRSIEMEAISIKKDTVYRFLNSSRYNWRKFLLLLGTSAIKKFVAPLTSDDRVKVLVVDDSLYDRSRSKKVELLAKVYDHVTRKYVRGFRMLTLGWSDGATFLPVSFSLLSSTKEKNRIQGINENLDKRYNGYKRRSEAFCKATDMAVELVEKALKQNIPASYVLFDSWFAFPSVINKIHDMKINVICMTKRMPHVFYIYRKKHINLEGLYHLARKKKTGGGNILASVQVNLIKGKDIDLPVKVVFVLKRGTKKKDKEGNSGWLAILSTDVSLSDEEIVRIYGIRWDIEVFFKTTKSLLCLAKEFQGRSYDLLVAHTSIVFVRYIMLALQCRWNEDGRSCGSLFYQYCQEIKDMDVVAALGLILLAINEAVRTVLGASEEKLEELFRVFKSLLPMRLQRFHPVSTCES